MRPDWLRIGTWSAAVALCLAFWLTVGGCAMGLFRTGDDSEEPPPHLVAKGLNPAFRLRVIEDPLVRDQVCRAAGVKANDEFNRKLIAACADLNGKEVIVGPNISPSRLRHEYAHSWFYQHNPGGKGWVAPPANVFAQQPAQHNWANAFDPKPAENIFKSR